MNRDVYGEALYDFQELGELKEPLLLHSSYGDIEEMPVEVFFREEDDIPELEYIALSLCDGKVLDVGAGAGVHALYLQSKGFDVDAMEISETACKIMEKRGVKNVIHADFFKFKEKKYDTLLFLMNGIGISGTIEGFRELLIHSKELLTERGQLLFDSSNISYLYDEYRIQRPDHYFGEINFQYEYKGNMGQPFQWLYIDQQTLIKIAHEENWVVQVLFEDDNDQYLVRMEPREM
ncbi:MULTISPECIES: bifunctional 2-polyprenyl-6-hydroxyphenol methylase/3-demethylubiquinol 3-O-methyltransferase UbiG [Sphingobacterium]|jgi:SAM-dependent methyltransferase|uniref:class I SAM-dependent methyltransferase n=1 Tax=Sphingobacterium TaxID=28453 RepID=UPI000C0BB90E|nr:MULTISPECIES: methyltransferase domain-containing protein [Sphingobacterium]MCT1530257.1 methyltransferase domain-containing protein [Sphingobacterium daejeonense]